MNDAPLGLLFAILAALLLFSAFFSSSETGMMSLNRYRLKHLAKSLRGARNAKRLLDTPDSLISMILIGNNLVNIFASAIATVIGLRLLGDSGVFVATLMLTFVVLIFAEIIPKTIAAYHPERIAFPFSHVLLPLRWLLTPFIWITGHITNGLLRLLGVTKAGDTPLNMDELRTILDEEGQAIPQRRRGMLLNILELEEVSVDHIMIPRAEVFGVDIDDEADKVLEQLQSFDYTRIPVYHEDDINNILGILHQRDVSKLVDAQGKLDKDKLRATLREPYFVPEGTPLHVQLFNFQKHSSKMAIVVDEYGVMQGIVTLEDLLAEIVGEFATANEEDNEDIDRQDDGSYIIDGSATIRDINKSLDWDLPSEGAKTLNGLLLEQLDSFPQAAVSLSIENYRIEVISVEENMIQSAKVQAVA